MPIISLIIPCYNEQESLPLLYNKLNELMNDMSARWGIDFELLFINDGSTDKTLYHIKLLAEKDKRVRYVSFSRNFGKESAIYAGLNSCTGDFVSLLDADLQHPPDLLDSMYKSIVEEGYDCVAAKRCSRKGEPIIRSFFSRKFYSLINMLSDTKMVDGATDYAMMTRQMVDAILQMKEFNRFSKGMYSWVGFETKWIAYENVERVAGTTKWSFWNLFLYSLDGIISFSTKPLAVASFSGIFFCFLSAIIIAVVVLKTILFGDPVAGFPTLICVVFFIGGIQLFCLGILGQYMARTYLEVKQRPVYIVKESLVGKE